MKVKKVSILILSIIFSLVGCSSHSNIVDGQLIHDEQTSQDFGKKIEIAYNEEDFKALWKNINFTGDLPNIAFDKSAVLFAQTFENSCPKNIEKFEINDEGNILMISEFQKLLYFK